MPSIQVTDFIVHTGDILLDPISDRWYELTSNVEISVGLYAEGRLHTSKWEKAKGQTQSRTEIIVDRLVLLSPKKESAAEATHS